MAETELPELPVVGEPGPRDPLHDPQIPEVQHLPPEEIPDDALAPEWDEFNHYTGRVERRKRGGP